MRDDGICGFYRKVAVAEYGNMPKEVLQKCGASYFGYEKVGINRRFLSKNMGESVDALITVEFDPLLNTDNICIIDDCQYTISFIQQGTDEDGLKELVLQLEAIRNEYEIKED